jgi:hypothetical protein
MHSMGRALVVFIAAAAPLVACGPSFQVIYEGNSRFEHCYALEENPQASMPAKAACWRDWSERYSYGQTRDRINYATARYVALSEAPNAPTDEALMMAAPGETPRATVITAPAPTNAFAPPPKVLEPVEQKPAHVPHANAADVPVIAVDAGPDPPLAAPLPAASCADRCGGAFQRCTATCGGGAGGSPTKACQGCPTAYRACMRDCFR